MKRKGFERQVALLLEVLPEVAKETCFALQGGTAINLFVQDMPRLSVDIDLTYIPIEDRKTSLMKIEAALERIKRNIEKHHPALIVQHKQTTGKLFILRQGAVVKVEVNFTNRGSLSEPAKMVLSEMVQRDFSTFAEIQVVPNGQLYGGKICAALDRQHPRDLFDVKCFLGNIGFTDEVKKGFLYCLLCSDRPINEVLKPHFQDQRSTLAYKFEGMTNEPFGYEEFENIRTRLMETIHEKLTVADRHFLLSVKRLEPDWSIHDFERFPAVQWKLHNLRKLKETNPRKHLELYQALKQKLE